MMKRAQRQLTWWNLGVMISLLGLVVLAMYIAISRGIASEIDTQLTDTASLLQRITPGMIEARPNSGRPASNFNQDDDHHEEEEQQRLALTAEFYFVMDSQGKVIVNSRNISDTALPNKQDFSAALKDQSNFRNLRTQNNLEIRLYTVPIRSRDERIVGALQVGTNISQHEEQLRQVLVITGAVAFIGLAVALVAAFFLTGRALIPIRQMVNRQREFVADASHELRTPLSIIRANAEIVLRAKNKTVAQQAEHLEDICVETDHLTRLVSDLATLARADMGKLEIQPEHVELKKMAREVARQVLPLATEKKLAFEFDESDSGVSEIWLKGDPTRIRQLLLILLDNAIKYTPAGKVNLHIAREGHHATIKVSDTGIGIPHDKLDMVFERFYRVDKARSRNEGGFGLGLPIARWIVETHHGSIKANSHPGQGTTFTVTFPLESVKN